METHYLPPKSSRLVLQVIVFLVVVLSIPQSATSLKNLKARIAVRYHGTSKSEHGETDKDSKHTMKPSAHSNVEVLTSKADSDYVLSQNILKGSIFLECVASYPIQWVYDGPGHPHVETYAETRRSFTNFKDSNTYLYFAKIYLVKIGEENTGKYSCRSLADETVEVYYYLFVPGPKFFVTESGHSVQGKAYEEKITIPCAISHKSNVTVELFKVGEMNHPDHISMATYDPKTGFTMERKYLKDEPWGTYICTCGNDSLTNSIMIDVLPPKQLFLRPTVKGNYVYQDENIKQRFICEAKSNITLEFSPGLQHGGRRSKVTYRHEEDLDFPFIASLEAEPMEFANYSLVSCILNDNGSIENGTDFALRRNPIYHTWEYSVYGNNKNLTFTYSKKLDSFLCCTANSYVTPEMSHFRPCSSLQECQLRNFRHEKHLKLDMINQNLLSPEAVKVIQHYSSPESKVPGNRLPVGCTGLKRYDSDHDGFFRCSVPASPVPLTLSLPQKEEMNVQDFFYSSLKGKPILSFQELTSNEEIIVITVGNNTGMKPVFKVHEEVQVSCRTNSFFFSKGHQWSFQRKNGSVELVPADLIREEVVDPMKSLSRKINLIKFPDVEINLHLPKYDPGQR
ncbi:unnamed protein product [Allacma fusca]|uniref:Ig-like domain-containing protein n=1 Tax=Allacma fusca TaxID=39272 RepID=A0A8J2KII7_9HEXA|nr:unnamed protein product [Allacma fusca]